MPFGGSTRGAVPFNGGTITLPLEVAPATGGSSAFIIRADPNDPTFTSFVVDQHGNLSIASGGSFQEAFIDLSDNTSGNAGHIRLDTFLGVQLTPEASSNTVLGVGANTGHTGLALSVTSAAGANTLRVSADNKIGFYDHAVAAQQTLTSGTATPEQIALALQANGFCGGT